MRLANLLLLTYNNRMVTQRVTGTLSEEDVGQLFSRLEGLDKPTASDIDLLMKHALRFAELGYAQKGRELIKRWQKTGAKDPDLALVRNSLIFAVPSSAAIHRIKALSSVDHGVAANDVNHLVYRGELARAIEIAQAHGWFLESSDYTEGLLFALQAMALMGKLDQAEDILESWKKRYAEKCLEKTQMVLRFESRLAYWRYQYSRELNLLLDAQALCHHLGLNAATAYTEPDVVRALVHCGQMEQAEAIIRTWEDSTEALSGPLLGFRDRARMVFELYSENYSEAEAHGKRVQDFYSSIGNATLVSSALFFLALVANRSTFLYWMEALRAHVYRFQVPFYLDRLKALEKALQVTGRIPREIFLVERGSRVEGKIPLWRLWMPSPQTIGAEVYLDRVRDVLFIKGHGHLSLVEHPVLGSILEKILATSDFRVAIPDLFAGVWGGVYNPIVHDGKIHVSIHRLRSWFSECCPDSKGLVEVRDHMVGFGPDLDIRIVELDQEYHIVESGHSVGVVEQADRILQCLSDGISLPPRTLQRRLGIGRTSLGKALRYLVMRGEIQRMGSGRSVCYKTRYDFSASQAYKRSFYGSEKIMSLKKKVKL